MTNLLVGRRLLPFGTPIHQERAHRGRSFVPGAALGKNGLTFMEDTWLSVSEPRRHSS